MRTISFEGALLLSMVAAHLLGLLSWQSSEAGMRDEQARRVGLDTCKLSYPDLVNRGSRLVFRAFSEISAVAPNFRAKTHFSRTF